MAETLTPITLDEIKLLVQKRALLLLRGPKLDELENRCREYIRNEDNSIEDRATAIRHFAAFFFLCKEALTQDDPAEFIVSEFMIGDQMLRARENN